MRPAEKEKSLSAKAVLNRIYLPQQKFVSRSQVALLTMAMHNPHQQNNTALQNT